MKVRNACLHNRLADKDKVTVKAAQEKLGELAVFAQLTAFLAVAQEQVRRVSTRSHEVFESINSDLDGYEARRDRLSALFKATAYDTNPILARLAALRKGSRSGSAREKATKQAERLVRLIMLGDRPLETVQ